MSRLALIGRPFTVFDPENKQHRRWYYEFVNHSTWGHCPVRFVVPDDQVSLAIGRNGQNVRLASKLTGYNITLIKEGGEDIELIEFRDEIGKEMYENIINLGIDTAREFLDADIYDLLEIPGMTKNTLLEFRDIILSEFEEQEVSEIRDAILLANTFPDDSTPNEESAE